MAREPFNILFLCTGNSARSILAESIMNRVGQGNFRAYSAESHPKGEVHPRALKLLRNLNFPTDHLRSKSWSEFEALGAPAFDFIVTVCDNAAGEVCPVWPGKPVRSHWGIADPAAVSGSDVAVTLAFAEAFRLLSNRITLFACLPSEKLEGISIKREMDEIGRARAIVSTDATVEEVAPASPDLNTMMDWLAGSRLPVSDLADAQPRYFVLRDQASSPLAFAGLAGYPPDMMLRSVVVDPSRRGNGAGRRIVDALTPVAKETGVRALWLMTEFSQEFCRRLGWTPIDRSGAPPSIAASAQFTSVCPASAVLMRKPLT